MTEKLDQEKSSTTSSNLLVWRTVNRSGSSWTLKASVTHSWIYSMLQFCSSTYETHTCYTQAQIHYDNSVLQASIIIITVPPLGVWWQSCPWSSQTSMRLFISYLGKVRMCGGLLYIKCRTLECNNAYCTATVIRKHHGHSTELCVYHIVNANFINHTYTQWVTTAH